MTKTFCDKCGSEGAESVKREAPFRTFVLDLCPKCKEKFQEELSAYIKNRKESDNAFSSKW